MILFKWHPIFFRLSLSSAKRNEKIERRDFTGKLFIEIIGIDNRVVFKDIPNFLVLVLLLQLKISLM